MPVIIFSETFRNLEGEGKAVVPDAVRADGETPQWGNTAGKGEQNHEIVSDHRNHRRIWVEGTFPAPQCPLP